MSLALIRRDKGLAYFRRENDVVCIVLKCLIFLCDKNVDIA